MSEDFDVDLDYLIALVQERPSLWDKTSEDFSNRFQRANEWSAICNILFPDYDEFDDIKRNRIGNDVVKKWRSVKDNFFRYVKKVKENRESGLPAKKMKRYHYYNQLRFLLKVADPKSDLQQETDNSRTNRTPEPMEAQSSSTSSTTTAPATMCLVPFVPASFKRPRLEPEIQRPHPDPEIQRPRVEPEIQRPRPEPENIPTEPLGTREEREERHMLFFRAIMPAIANFTDLQFLTFQCKVIQIITEIRFGPQSQNVISSSSVGYQTAEDHQSPNTSRTNTNGNSNDDSQEEFDFTVKIERE